MGSAREILKTRFTDFVALDGLPGPPKRSPVACGSVTGSGVHGEQGGRLGLGHS